MIDWSWLLIVLGAVLVLLEVSFGGFAGFDLVLVGSAFLIGGVVGVLRHDPASGYLTASVLGVLYFAVGRRLMRARLHAGDNLRSNVDALSGRQAVVQQRVAVHEAGLVKVGDEVWRALPAAGAAGPYEVGAVVTVEGVDGVTLQVR